MSYGDAYEDPIALRGQRVLAHHSALGLGADYLCHRRLQHPAHPAPDHDQPAGQDVGVQHMVFDVLTNDVPQIADTMERFANEVRPWTP